MSDSVSRNGSQSGSVVSESQTFPGVATIAQVTQAQYNAIVTKDPNTLYVIVG